jgi:hypothetical protein
MPTFNNLQVAYEFIKNNVKNSFEDLSKEIYRVIQLYIEERQYDWTPKDYIRTMEYLNSLTISEIKSNGNGYSVEIYFDTNKIIPHTVEGNWNQHEDFWGNPTSEFIPLWLEEGSPNNPYFQHPGNHAVRDALNEFKNGKAIRELQMFLKKRGFNCKIK